MTVAILVNRMLRVHDRPALQATLERAARAVPLFVFRLRPAAASRAGGPAAHRFRPVPAG